jgi:TrmH family RNA methyltransferase
MLSNNQLKWIRSLHQKKFREQEACFLAEGYKVVEEALHSGMEIRLIAGTPEFLHRMKTDPAATAAIEFVECSAAQMERISTLSTAPDGLAVIQKPRSTDALSIDADRFYLVLDGIRDPGNLGTILRIVDWFGLGEVVLSPDTVEEFNPKVVQSAMGSLFRVKIRRLEVEQFLKAYSLATPNEVLAAVMDGSNLYGQSLPRGACLVLGNESEGIRSQILRACTRRLSIPGFFEQEQGPESLNVAVSAAVFASEYRRLHPRL